LCLEIREAFGVRLSFWRFFSAVSPVWASLELVFRPVLDPFTPAPSNAAERTAPVQDAIASYCLEICEAFGVRLSFWRFGSLLYHRFAPVSNSCFDRYLIRLLQLHRKRQRDSRSPRRYRELLCLEICEAFGLRLSFWRFVFVVVSPVCASLELVFRPILDPFTPAQSKAAERTAPVHDAIASYCAWKSAKLWDCACPSGALFRLYHRFAPVSNSCFDRYLIHLLRLNRKRQRDSRSPRRYRELLCLEICEAFGVRLSFLALCFGCITGLRQSQTRVSTGT
jgi:hypothetical protein